MCAVAEWRFARFFAATKGLQFVLGSFPNDGFCVCVGVRAIAERLIFRQAARAPGVDFACLDLDQVWLFLRFCGFTHDVGPWRIGFLPGEPETELTRRCGL